MKKNVLYVTLFTLVLCLTFSILVSAATSNKQLMGTFKLKNNQAITINSQDYIPLKEVARLLDYDYNWERVKTNIKGHLHNQSFKSDTFIIAYGNLYLPIKLYEEFFDIEINIKGNKYYVYLIKSYRPIISDLKLILQTDKTYYQRYEPIAVSLLLLNQSDRTYTLRFNSSKKYDLTLKQKNRGVWNFSENKNYLQSLSFEVLKSGDHRLFTILIEPGKDRYLSSDEYTLKAEISATNGIIMSNELDIKFY